MKRRARYGDGSIYRRPDGKWEAVVSVGSGAQRRRRKMIARTEREALDHLRRLRGEMLVLRGGGETGVSLETYLRRWLDDIVRPAVRPKTYSLYESVLRTHVYPRLGAARIDRLRHEQLVAMFGDLERAGVGARLREVAYLRLRTAFGYATGRVVTVNPMLGVPRPRVPRRSMTTWTPVEARAFLAATSADELGVLYRLALSTGMRRGELLGLRWRDVDLAAGRLRVTHTLTDDGEIVEPKTASARRAIELPARAVEALRDQRKRLLALGLRTSPWVFPVEGADDPRRGAPRLSRAVSRAFNAAQRRVNRELRAADPVSKGLPTLRFHDLRHTAATLLLGEGVHPKIVSEILGHAKTTITLDLYSHATPTMQRGAMERMDALL